MDKTVILGIVRHILTTGGGVLVTDGYVTSSELNELVGGAVVLIGILWSIAHKKGWLAA